MTEYTWVKTYLGWRLVRVDQAPKVPAARSAYPCPRISSDTMDLTEHIDGKFYDSKSAFRAVTKANGCIEVGNDPARLRPKEREKPKIDGAVIERAMNHAGIQ